jgi:hypothetical protein
LLKRIILEITMRSDWVSYDVLGRIGEAPEVDTVHTTADSAVDALRIESLSRLVQAVGYLKYRAPDGNSYLRGQPSLYRGTVEPTLFRGVRDVSSLERQLNKLIGAAADWKCEHPDHSPTVCSEILAPAPKSSRRLFKAGVPRYAAEPLLQHYGIHTRWIDVVDNVWVALWFACHRFIRVNEHIHVVRRNVADGGEDFVYIITITTLGKMMERRPGFYRCDDGTRVIDLRKAIPSFYLRPHAQHGLLIRPQADQGEFQLAALQIPLARALEWLGSSVLLSPFGLFPPASVDVGYRRLLDYIKYQDVNQSLGYIDIIGPGY